MSEQEEYLGPYPCYNCKHWDRKQWLCAIEDYCLSDPDLSRDIEDHYEPREEDFVEVPE